MKSVIHNGGTMSIEEIFLNTADDPESDAPPMSGGTMSEEQVLPEKESKQDG